MLKRKITLFPSKIDTDKCSFSDFSFVFGFISFCSFVKTSLILQVNNALNLFESCLII